jgi:hypothetical protein
MRTKRADGITPTQKLKAWELREYWYNFWVWRPENEKLQCPRVENVSQLREREREREREKIHSGSIF